MFDKCSKCPCMGRRQAVLQGRQLAQIERLLLGLQIENAWTCNEQKEKHGRLLQAQMNDCVKSAKADEMRCACADAEVS